MQTTINLKDLNKTNIENIFGVDFDKTNLEMPFEYKYFIAQDNESKLITFKNLVNVDTVKIKLVKTINKNFNTTHYYLQFKI